MLPKRLDYSEARSTGGESVIGSDYNNDRAVDIVVPAGGPTILENPREGKFIAKRIWPATPSPPRGGVLFLILTTTAGWTSPLPIWTHQVSLCGATTMASHSSASLFRNQLGPSLRRRRLRLRQRRLGRPGRRRRNERRQGRDQAVPQSRRRTASKTSPPTLASTRFISKAARHHHRRLRQRRRDRPAHHAESRSGGAAAQRRRQSESLAAALAQGTRRQQVRHRHES